MLLGLIHLGIAVLKPVIADAWSGITYVSGLAAHGLYTLAVKVEKGLTDLAHTAYGWALNAIHYADGLVNQAKHDLTAWAGDALDFVGKLVSALNRDVIQPLYKFAHDGWDYLTKTLIPDIVGRIERAAKDAADAIGQVIGDVATIADKLAHTVDRWFPVLEKAWAWLVWFALNPLEGFLSLWHDLTAMSGQSILAGLSQAIADHGEAFEEWLVQWLGK
jgi:hypothetical protein